MDRGELDRAMELLIEQERICRELGDPAGLQTSPGNEALIHKARGELDRAMELLIEQERTAGEPATRPAFRPRWKPGADRQGPR